MKCGLHNNVILARVCLKHDARRCEDDAGWLARETQDAHPERFRDDFVKCPMCEI